MRSMPRRWPSTWPPASGRSSTTPSGRSSPSAPAAGAGKMYPIGSNAINDRTIGESAQGLADYVKEQCPAGAPLACAIAYDTRHRSRAVRRAVRRDHGRRRLHGVLPRRLSQHAGAVVHRALQAVRLRHHGHGQPQPAQRQRGEGLLVHRRADPAAARQGRHRPRDERRARSPRCRSPRPWPQGKVVYCQDEVDAGVPRSGRSAELRRAARAQDHLFAAARRGRVGVLPVLAGRRLQGRRGLWPARRAERRLSQRAGARLEPREPGGVRRHHRAGQGDRRRPDPGHRSRLRPPGLRRAADDRRGGEWRTFTGNQIGALLADYVLERRKAARLAVAASITSSRRWSRPR